MRTLLLAATLVAGWLGVGATSWAGEPAAVEVTSVRDFQALGQRAEARDLPILLMFSSPFCSYCELVQEDFLEPMLRSGDYDDRVLIAKVQMVVGSRKITDFQGESITIDALAARYDVGLTPTVVFLDSEGHALAENLEGITTTAYYGGYLDDGID
ncbi:MAG TPA: thioredoxin fold domain-containing protein, partial [Gammaproteobacteria bacterium]|nr:thioredoxin fold domain-containing protein [Gammaproteobacteria bacterium]